MEKLKDNVTKIATPQNVISLTLSDASSFGIKSNLAKWSSLERYFISLQLSEQPANTRIIVLLTYSFKIVILQEELH